jgi:hypothetical protein
VIGEAVIAPEASYGLALLGNELKSRIRGHGIAEYYHCSNVPIIACDRVAIRFPEEFDGT